MKSLGLHPLPDRLAAMWHELLMHSHGIQTHAVNFATLMARYNASQRQQDGHHPGALGWVVAWCWLTKKLSVL